MTRAVFGTLLAAALVAGLALRFVDLDARIVHHDEANQARKFGVLLETGDYRYDRSDHHGPTLYYLTLPSAWAFGQRTFASIDEWTIRVVPALFGAGLILLIGGLGRALGRRAAVAAAVLAAVSPALVYFSRFYIQETLFLFFSLAFLVAFGRVVWQPRLLSALAAGLLAGLAFSTKETFVIVIAAAALAALVARAVSNGPGPGRRPMPSPAQRAGMLGAGLLTAAAVSYVLYSSFFRYPSGPIEAIRAFGIYAERGVGAGGSGWAEPWHYYLRILAYSSSGGVTWSEGLILALAAVGLAGAFRSGQGFWPRYIALYAVTAAAGFSAVSYKTPWNLLPFYGGFVVLAGIGVDTLVSVWRARPVRALLVLLLVAGVCHLGAQAWRASVRYGSDTRNPYVYAHTTPDFLRLVQRVKDLSAIHPDGARMFVMVVAGPYEQWPIPWYLRRMTRVGYWPQAAGAPRFDAAPVIISSQENAAAIGAALGERYVTEFYGLRPDVLLTVYIERTLWERFLAARAGMTAAPAARTGMTALPAARAGMTSSPAAPVPPI